MDKIKMIERLQRALSRQNTALKGTLEEIELIESLEAKQPGTYGPAITALHTKRDRQATLVKATDTLLTGIKASRK